MKGAVSGAVAAAIVPLAAAQEKKPADANIDRRLAETEKKLAKPLTPEARKLTREALKAVEKSMADRLKTKLPENSEPCILYVATEHKR